MRHAIAVGVIVYLSILILVWPLVWSWLIAAGRADDAMERAAAKLRDVA